jgi:hypothetical protein
MKNFYAILMAIFLFSLNVHGQVYSESFEGAGAAVTSGVFSSGTGQPTLNPNISIANNWMEYDHLGNLTTASDVVNFCSSGKGLRGYAIPNASSNRKFKLILNVAAGYALNMTSISYKHTSNINNGNSSVSVNGTSYGINFLIQQACPGQTVTLTQARALTGQVTIELFAVNSGSIDNAEFAFDDFMINGSVVALPATHLNFDGANDLVNLPNTVIDNQNSGSIEVWIKPNALTNMGVFSKQHDFVNTYPTIGVGYSPGASAIAGKVYFHVINGFPNLQSTTTLSTGQWYHIAATWNSTTASLYINGVLEQTLTGSYAIPSDLTAVTTIGSHNNNFFSGNMDEFRIWNTTLSADDILRRKNCEIQVNESGLVAYYKFNQGLDAATNTGITTLTNSTATVGLNGTLTGFALSGSTSNWLAGSPVTTGNTIPTTPSVSTPVTYCQNATASALTATGSSLKWYTAATGGVGSSTAITPTTTTVGTTSYWVTSSNANGCESARAKIDVTINAKPTVSITGANAICVGATTTLSPTTGGTWASSNTAFATVTNAGVVSGVASGAPTFTFTQTSTGCVSLATAAVTVNAIPSAPSVSNVTYIQGATASALTATGTSLKWYTAATGGTGSATAPTPSTTTVGTTSHWVSQTVSTCESPRAKIDVTVNTVEYLPYHIGAAATGSDYLFYGLEATLTNFTTCQFGGTVTFSASNYNGTWTNGNFDYYINNTFIGSASGSIVVDLTPYLPITSVKVVKTSYANWNTVDIQVNTQSFTSSMPATGPTVANVSYCQGATPSALTATMTGTGASLKWYTTAFGDSYSATAPTPTTGTVGTTSYWVAQANSSGCESVRSKIDVIINALPTAPSITTPVTYCINATATALTTTGTSLKWYTAATGGTGSATAPTPSTTTAGTTSYWVSQTDANTCESPRAKIDVTINALPSAPTVSPVSYCQNATASALTATGTNLKWYTVATGGTGSATAPTPSTATVGTTSYWVSQTVSTCEGARAKIDVTINALPSAPSVSNLTYAQGATASALTATGTSLLWYTAATGGTGSATAPTPSTTTVGTTSYWVSQTVSTCGSPRAKIDVVVALPATHLNFDGANDAITATNSNFPLGNTARTIEAWIKTTQNNGGGAILTYGNLSANNRFALYQSGGNLNFVAEGNDYNTGVAINDGVWHHVAATFDGTNLKIYKDGVQVGTTQFKIFNTTGTQLSIGYRGVAAEYFNGNIDEVRIWNVAVSADDILRRKNCELAGTESGLVAYYKFNQGIDALTNTGLTTLTNSTATTGLNGTLTGFALTGATSNWLAGSPVTTGSTIPTTPSVSTPVTYCINATASALTATGTSLKWYTSATGGVGSSTAPTPTTTTAGNTSYWVTSSNANGCESERAKLDVITGDCNEIHTGTAGCYTATLTNVQGNSWFNFISPSGVIASLNPNGMNLGTVTVEVSDASGVVTFNSKKFLGRSVNFMSSNYASGVTMPNNYSLRLYYMDSELTEYNSSTSGSYTLPDFNMMWEQGGTGCSLPTYGGNVEGMVEKANVVEAEYGTGDNGFYLQLPLNHFTIFAATTSTNTVLPLELVSFNGYAKNNSNILAWRTEAEQNFSHFELQHGLNGIDFETMSPIKAKGQGSDYGYTHQNPTAATHYYRLKMVDNDGAFKFSQVISLNKNETKTLKIYPNPTKNTINIMTSDYAQPMRLYSINGALLMSKNQTTEQLDISELPTGMYFLHVGSDVLKVIKE